MRSYHTNLGAGVDGLSVREHVSRVAVGDRVTAFDEAVEAYRYYQAEPPLG